MYGGHDGSLGPQLLTGGMHAAAVCGVAWLLLGPGADPPDWRHVIVFGMSLVYLLRTVVSMVMAPRRAMPWAQAVADGAWIAAMHLALAGLTVVGGHHGSTVVVSAGVVLYLLGSLGSSVADVQRKRRQDNPQFSVDRHAHGFFRRGRHVDRYGEAVLFTGFALATANWWALAAPAVLTAIILFVDIPESDRQSA